MNIVNLTPHELNVQCTDGTMLTIPPSGSVARLSTTREVVGEIDGIAVYKTTFGQLTGLPDPAPDTVFVVSALVAQAVPERQDVFAPGEGIRDEAGRIIGCRGLSRV